MYLPAIGNIYLLSGHPASLAKELLMLKCLNKLDFVRMETRLGDLYLLACDGNRKAAQELVSTLSGMVVATVRKAGVPADSVEDVANIAWLKLFDSKDKIREPNAIAGWLKTTTYNQAMQWHRDSARQPVAANSEVEEAGDEDPGFQLIEDEEVRTQRMREIRIALSKLDDRCKRLIGLKTQVPKRTNREIGDELGMPIGSVAPTHGRCLDKLRAILQTESA